MKLPVISVARFCPRRLLALALAGCGLYYYYYYYYYYLQD
jgi:hypothetical protein